jgi:hypothetical protein
VPLNHPLPASTVRKLCFISAYVPFLSRGCGQCAAMGSLGWNVFGNFFDLLYCPVHLMLQLECREEYVWCNKKVESKRRKTQCCHVEKHNSARPAQNAARVTVARTLISHRNNNSSSLYLTIAAGSPATWNHVDVQSQKTRPWLLRQRQGDPRSYQAQGVRRARTGTVCIIMSPVPSIGL